MKMPRIRAARLASAMLAGGMALSTVVGPALLPGDMGGSPARAAVVVNIDIFHRELSPYGRWGRDPRYGEVWYPAVAQGWRPYYDDGHWAYSDDYGWLWVSERPWGWAPFHYGRWVLTGYGWAWVPGTVWGPAWVTFRSTPDYIGWAPLPPEAYWDDGYGFRRRYDVPDVRCWTFVRPGGFVAHRFDRYVYDRRDYPRFINRTTNITNITVINNRVVNRGIDVRHVERETHRHVDRFAVAAGDRPERTEIRGNKVILYKPSFAADSNHRERMNSGSVANDRQDQPTTKRRHGNDVDRGVAAQRFVAPDGQHPAGNDDQTQQWLRKKHHQDNAALDNRSKRQQFGAPEEMQPAAGGDQAQQLPVKKKHRTSATVGNDGSRVQFGAASDDRQPTAAKRRQSQVQDQARQQPRVREQQAKPQKQQRYQVNRKNQHQCQNGDPVACGN